jgi:threonine dehydratase
MNQPSISDIREAAERINSIVHRTPLAPARWLSNSDRLVQLKLECLQPTGSFKLRGAAAKLTSLTDEQKKLGILTVSAGNHGLAVAHCAELLGLDATIVVPTSASRAKVSAIQRYPVKLIELGQNYDEAERNARGLASELGLTFVSPYNDFDVIAGQGTAGLEIFDSFEGLDTVVVPVGGGGLIAGVAIALKSLNPSITIFGVEPENSPTMTAALKAGRVVEIAEELTIADGLAGNIELDCMTFPIVQEQVDEMLLVSERSMERAIAQIAQEERLMIEGSAAAAIAALEDRRLQTGSIAAIVTGRNITLDLFSKAVSG